MIFTSRINFTLENMKTPLLSIISLSFQSIFNNECRFEYILKKITNMNQVRKKFGLWTSFPSERLSNICWSIEISIISLFLSLSSSLLVDVNNDLDFFLLYPLAPFSHHLCLHHWRILKTWWAFVCYLLVHSFISFGLHFVQKCVFYVLLILLVSLSLSQTHTLFTFESFIFFSRTATAVVAVKCKSKLKSLILFLVEFSLRLSRSFFLSFYFCFSVFETFRVSVCVVRPNLCTGISKCDGKHSKWI